MHTCDVVIATRNRRSVLQRCLTGLQRQSTAEFGVIVVDDHSDEPVDDVVAAAAGGLETHVIRLPEQSGPAAARNAGVAASSAEYVIFVDDDVYPSRQFVAAHLAAVTGAADGAPVVSCGPFAQPADWTPTPWNLWEARLLKREADALTSGAWPLTWRNFHTGNNCVPRAVFDEIGGFDPYFKRAEDDELALRLHQLGCHFHFEPAAIAWHYANRSLDAWLAIPRAYAFFDVAIDRRHPEEGYLAHKEMTRQQRRLPLRIARAAFAGELRTRIGVKLGVGAGRALYRLGWTSAAMGGLSMAYELSYARALAEARESC